MIFSVFDDGNEWSLVFGPVSALLTLENLAPELTISYGETVLAAWNLLLSQREDSLNNHLARVPITPNQERTMEMKDEVLSSVGAQDMDTSGYQMCDLDDFDFYYEKDQLDVDDIFRPFIDTPFS